MNKFDEGVEAARAGLEFWKNPYTGPKSNKAQIMEWFEGWCYGKRFIAETIKRGEA